MYILWDTFVSVLWKLEMHDFTVYYCYVDFLLQPYLNVTIVGKLCVQQSLWHPLVQYQINNEGENIVNFLSENMMNSLISFHIPAA